MRAWLAILRERYPGVLWVASDQAEQATTPAPNPAAQRRTTVASPTPGRTSDRKLRQAAREPSQLDHMPAPPGRAVRQDEASGNRHPYEQRRQHTGGRRRGR
jgi:hypothetical protein